MAVMARVASGALSKNWINIQRLQSTLCVTQRDSRGPTSGCRDSCVQSSIEASKSISSLGKCNLPRITKDSTAAMPRSPAQFLMWGAGSPSRGKAFGQHQIRACCGEPERGNRGFQGRWLTVFRLNRLAYLEYEKPNSHPGISCGAPGTSRPASVTFASCGPCSRPVAERDGVKLADMLTSRVEG